MKSWAWFSSYRVSGLDFAKTFKSLSRIFKPGSQWVLDFTICHPFKWQWCHMKEEVWTLTKSPWHVCTWPGSTGLIFNVRHMGMNGKTVTMCTRHTVLFHFIIKVNRHPCVHELMKCLYQRIAWHRVELYFPLSNVSLFGESHNKYWSYRWHGSQWVNQVTVKQASTVICMSLKVYKQWRRKQPPFFILICLMRPTPNTLETSSVLKIPTYGYSCSAVVGKRLSIKVVVAQFQNSSLLFTCKAYRIGYWPK